MIEKTKEEIEAICAEKAKEYAANIDEYSIGQIVKDKDGADVEITDKAANSIQVFIKKKNLKHGIDSKQWLDMKTFNNRFRL